MMQTIGGTYDKDDVLHMKKKRGKNWSNTCVHSMMRWYFSSPSFAYICLSALIYQRSSLMFASCFAHTHTHTIDCTHMMKVKSGRRSGQNSNCCRARSHLISPFASSSYGIQAFLSLYLKNCFGYEMQFKKKSWL